MSDPNIKHFRIHSCFIFHKCYTFINGRVVLSTSFTNRKNLQNDMCNSMLRKPGQKLSQNILFTPSLLKKPSYKGRAKTVLSNF